MVDAVARAWVRLDQRPLEARWAEALAELRAVAPNISHGMMATEPAYDDLKDLIAKLRAAKAPPEPDRFLAAAIAEWGAERRAYHAIWMQIRDAQRHIYRIENTWPQRCLGIISDDLKIIPGMIDQSVDTIPTFANVEEARAATKDIAGRKNKLKARLDRINESLRFEALKVVDPKCMDLIRALFRRVEALEEQVNQSTKAKAA